MKEFMVSHPIVGGIQYFNKKNILCVVAQEQKSDAHMSVRSTQWRIWMSAPTFY